MLKKETLLFATKEDVNIVKNIVQNKDKYPNDISDLLLYAAYGASKASVTTYEKIFADQPVLTCAQDISGVHALIVDTHFFKWYELRQLQCDPVLASSALKKGHKYKPLLEFLIGGKIKTRQKYDRDMLDVFMRIPKCDRIPFMDAYIRHYIDPVKLLLDDAYCPQIESDQRLELIEMLSKQSTKTPKNKLKETELFL